MKVAFIGRFPHAELLMKELKNLGIYSFSVKKEFLIKNQERYDLIYYTNKSAEIRSMLREITYASKIKKPTLIGAHGSWYIKHHRPLPKGIITRLYSVTRIIGALLYKVRANIHAHFLNRFEHHFFQRILHNVHYAPLGIPVRIYKPSKEKFHKFTVLFYAARYQKGVDMLLHIVSRIAKRHIPIRFVLLGWGPQWSYFDKAKRKGVEVCVIPYHLALVKFIRLLARTHVYLNLSRYETFGVLILEALSCGTPVLGFYIPGVIQDIIAEENRLKWLIVEPFNLEVMLKKLIYLYELWTNDRKTYNNLSKNCRDVASHYDVSIVAKEWKKMFEKVLEYV